MSVDNSVKSLQVCTRCDSVDSLFIALDCRHRFCLVCMSYLFIKCRASGHFNDSVLCSQCGLTTHLAQDSVEAIKSTIEGTLLPNLNIFSENPPSLDRLTSIRRHTPTEPTAEKRSHGSKIVKRLSDGTTVEDQESSNGIHNVLSQSVKTSQLPYNIDLCRIHSFEQVKFACLTCYDYLLCQKCVNTKHKGHNTKMIGTAVEEAFEWLKVRRMENEQRIEECEMKERRLSDRKLFLRGKWERLSEQISDEFQKIVQKTKKKEAQMIEKCNEHYRGQEQAIEKELERVIKALNTYKTQKSLLKKALSQHVGSQEKKIKLARAIEFFEAYDETRGRLQMSIPRIYLQDLESQPLNNFICLEEQSIRQVDKAIRSITLYETSNHSPNVEAETIRLQLPQKYTSLNSSRQKSRRYLKTEDDSVGIMSKRRTQHILDTYENASSKKGSDRINGLSSYVSKFLDKHSNYTTRLSQKTQESEILHSLCRSKLNSTKVLTRTSNQDSIQSKNKKQLNFTKDKGGELVQELSSPQNINNYKTNMTIEGRRRRPLN